MDALVQAVHQRGRPRDTALFLILRYTGMRRESVATLSVRHVDPQWGLRGVRVKGGKTRDIPLPSAVTRYLEAYVETILHKELDTVTAETPLFWSTWGRRGGKTRAPMTGQNVWRLCKVYGRLIGYPMLKPHDLRHGVALEVWSNITTSKRSAHCWAMRGSIPPRSTRPFVRRSSSARWPSTRRRLRRC
jgi:site-specific recombinase XerD